MDILSLFLIEGIILLLFGVTMLVASIGQGSQGGNYWFAASNFCGAIGLLLRPLFPYESEVAAVLVPNLLLFVELALLYRAVAEFTGRGLKIWPGILTLPILATIFSAYVLYLHPNTEWLALCISAITISIPASAASLLFRYALPRIKIPMFTMGTLLVLYVLNNLLRLHRDWVIPQDRFNHILFDRTILAGLSVSYLLMSEAQLRHRLIDQASVDPLTGALNRRALESEAAQKLEGARRHGYSVSALMIDIDHFKRINDTHGHHAGDCALQELGALLHHTLRGSDLLVRLGGDEFLVIISGANSSQAQETATRIEAKIENLRIPSDKGEFGIQVSIGYASLEGRQINLDDLMKLSDRSLYSVKSARHSTAQPSGS